MNLDEWSLLWEAVAAVGTVVAVGWAVITTISEQRKRTDAENALTEEKAASRNAQRRGQADHIAVRFEVLPRPVLVIGRDGARHATTRGSAFVGNYSSAPVFNIVVAGEARQAEKIFELGDRNLVPPGSEPWEVDLRDAAEHANELALRVEFSDVAGVRWRRWSNGELEEIDA